METTLIEKTLIGFLKTSKASKGKSALVFLMLDNDTQMMEMCRYLSKNPEATEAEILTTAKKIANMPRKNSSP